MKNFLLLIIFLLVACKPSVPGDYLQPDELEDVLYDYYVAMAVADLKSDGEDYDKDPYLQAVLDKHGVTMAKFDTTMVYYTRHCDRLHKIYRNIAMRMEAEAVALGADAREISSFGENIAYGDTMNIWPHERALLLTQDMPHNVVSFTIPADSSYIKGDKIVWSFDTHFFYQEGQKNAVALLALKYDNDSVTTRTKSLTSSTHYTLELPKTDTLALKEVKGFICLLHDANATATTMKMLFVGNIRMVHSSVGRNEETGKEQQETKTDNDSSKTIEKKGDSLSGRKDTVTIGVAPTPLIKGKHRSK